MLDKNEYINQLLDWYDKLLTDRQLDVMKLYYREDLSLTEIAENLKISRSAVYDLIKRTSALMEDYESKLKLVSNYHQRMALYDDLIKSETKDVKSIVNKLIELE